MKEGEGEGGKLALTEGCIEALKEVFHRIDLDGNGYISRMEFDFFQEMTSGESCDDDAWKVIQGQEKLIFCKVHVVSTNIL